MTRCENTRKKQHGSMIEFGPPSRLIKGFVEIFRVGRRLIKSSFVLDFCFGLLATYMKHGDRV